MEENNWNRKNTREQHNRIKRSEAKTGRRTESNLTVSRFDVDKNHETTWKQFSLGSIRTFPGLFGLHNRWWGKYQHFEAEVLLRPLVSQTLFPDLFQMFLGTWFERFRLWTSAIITTSTELCLLHICFPTERCLSMLVQHRPAPLYASCSRQGTWMLAGLKSCFFDE